MIQPMRAYRVIVNNTQDSTAPSLDFGAGREAWRRCDLILPGLTPPVTMSRRRVRARMISHYWRVAGPVDAARV